MWPCAGGHCDAGGFHRGPARGHADCTCGHAQVDIATPEVFIGGLLGAMLVFLFSAWACMAVGRSAQAVVNEVHPAGDPSVHCV